MSQGEKKPMAQDKKPMDQGKKPPSFTNRLRAAGITPMHHFIAIQALILLPWTTSRLLLPFYALFAFTQTEKLLRALQHPSEPPLIPHPYLPFLGHVLGLFWHGNTYWEIVNRKTQYPIFTLQVLNGRTVGIVDAGIAGVVQKKSEKRSFYGVILEVAGRLVGFKEDAMSIVRDGLFEGNGLMAESNEMIEEVLSPGPMLREMVGIQMEKLSEEFAEIFPPNPVADLNSLEMSLMDFVKNIFTPSNAYAIYGPQNPFALHPELKDVFWEYEAGMIGCMADILPWLTARKAWKAREKLNAALKEYVIKGHWKKASPMIQRRVAINLKHGFTDADAGKSELIFLFGILGNAVPSVFWALCNIYSRPDLLNKIREETKVAIREEKASARGSSTNGAVMEKEMIINVTHLQNKCPLLLSTYRETLREVANLASVRLITEAHTIAAPDHTPYLLKKGSIIQIASKIIHSSPHIWGSDAHNFNASRFINADNNATSALPASVPSAAFRAFGGGDVICPGRHFAQSELVAFVALCVNMLDIEGEDGAVLEMPVKDERRIPLSAVKPVKEPRVRIRRRGGLEGVRWRVEV